MASLDSFPSDRGIKVTVGERKIAMFRVGGDVYAIGDRCSHAEASLAEGEVFGTTVECPRHGAEFDLTSGDAETLPATSPVPAYDVVVEDGTVFLDLEDV